MTTAAEQIPRPYTRAEDGARELNGDFGMTTLTGIEEQKVRLSFLASMIQ